MKTKQYCVIENSDGELSVSTFDKTEKGSAEAQALFTTIARQSGETDDIAFDWGCPDCIAEVFLGDFSVKLLES